MEIMKEKIKKKIGYKKGKIKEKYIKKKRMMIKRDLNNIEPLERK